MNYSFVDGLVTPINHDVVNALRDSRSSQKT